MKEVAIEVNDFHFGAAAHAFQPLVSMFFGGLVASALVRKGDQLSHVSPPDSYSIVASSPKEIRRIHEDVAASSSGVGARNQEYEPECAPLELQWPAFSNAANWLRTFANS